MEGNVYLGDTGNRRIRKVDPTGIIATIAGGGSVGVNADAGPALEASLTNSPFGLAAGDDGSLYFTEWQTSSVRRIDPLGIISTVVGPRGELGDCGPASEASIATPLGIAVHEGVLYIVDSGHDRYPHGRPVSEHRKSECPRGSATAQPGSAQRVSSRSRSAVTSRARFSRRGSSQSLAAVSTR